MRKNPRRRVIQAAAKQLPLLPPLERAELIEDIVPLLSEADLRELARYTVGLIRQAEEAQQKLFQELANLI